MSDKLGEDGDYWLSHRKLVSSSSSYCVPQEHCLFGWSAYIPRNSEEEAVRTKYKYTKPSKFESLAVTEKITLDYYNWRVFFLFSTSCISLSAASSVQVSLYLSHCIPDQREKCRE